MYMYIQSMRFYLHTRVFEFTS